MREIKFRAWDEQHKIMHHEFQFIKSGEEGNDWIVFTSDKQKLTDKPHPLDNPYLSQQLKIMQFTGLYDINDKEIYEGDIIKSEGRKLKVLWFDEGAQFIAQEMDDSGWDIMYSHGGRYEVVGNIYEM